MVIALNGYEAEMLDRRENFHGNQLVYLHWAKHNSFCAPLAFPFPPDMPFAAVREQIIPTFYGMHPDFARIDWAKVEWTLDGAPFTPDPAQGLTAQGVDHKSIIRFRTPGLDGYRGSGS